MERDQVLSTLGAGGRIMNLDVARDNLINTSNHFVMTPQHHHFRASLGRPQSTVDATAVARIRGIDYYFKNKNESE